MMTDRKRMTEGKSIIRRREKKGRGWGKGELKKRSEKSVKEGQKQGGD